MERQAHSTSCRQNSAPSLNPNKFRKLYYCGNTKDQDENKRHELRTGTGLRVLSSISVKQIKVNVNLSFDQLLLLIFRVVFLNIVIKCIEQTELFIIDSTQLKFTQQND